MNRRLFQQHCQALAKLGEEAKALPQQSLEPDQSYLAQLKEQEEKIRHIRHRGLAGLEEKRLPLDAQNLEAVRLNREADWAEQDAEALKANRIARVEFKRE